MLTLKYRTFADTQSFVNAVKKAYTCDSYSDFKSAYKIKRMCEGIEKELTTFINLRNELMAKVKKEEMTQEEFKTKLEELFDMDVELKWGPMTKQEVSCIKGLSPADIEAIEAVAEAKAFSDLQPS